MVVVFLLYLGRYVWRFRYFNEKSYFGLGRVRVAFLGYVGIWRLRDDFCYGSRYFGRRVGCG